MLTRCIVILALVTFVAGMGAADIVHLASGETFENVEAEIDEAKVRIEMGIGTIVVPRSEVLRIEESKSALAGYRSRERKLRRSDVNAEGWLELARWARRQEFTHGYKKAAVTAARLDPTLEGLSPVMRDLGWSFNQELGEWRRRGENRARNTDTRERHPSPPSTARRDRTNDALERRDDQIDKALDIISKQVDKEPAATTVVVTGGRGGSVLGTGLLVGPPLVGPPLITSPPVANIGGSVFGVGTTISQGSVGSLVNRIPGSFLPLQ